MTKKQYTAYRLIIAAVLGASISVAIVINNYYLPIVFVITAMAAMSYGKKRLPQGTVMADERDYKIAGDAARYTVFIYSWIGALTTFILMAVSGKTGVLYTLSQFFAYTVCGLMLLNASLFAYLSKRGK